MPTNKYNLRRTDRLRSHWTAGRNTRRQSGRRAPFPVVVIDAKAGSEYLNNAEKA
jgi:hypothetical protein